MIERPSLMDRRNLNDNRMHSALYWLVMAGEALDADTRKHLNWHRRPASMRASWTAPTPRR